MTVTETAPHLQTPAPSDARWRGAAIDHLAAAELGALAPGQTGWDGPELFLTPRAANALSLGLHELADRAVELEQHRFGLDAAVALEADVDDGLAVELGRKGIRVNAVAPGMIDTEMITDLPQKTIDAAIARIQIGRYGRPEEVARAIRFLASDEASYITGQIVAVDGGLGV